MMQQAITFERKPMDWLKDAWFLAKPYWQSQEKYIALTLVSLVILFNLLSIGATVLVNKWYNTFYNILQQYDKNAFFASIIKFCYIAFFYIAFQVLSSYILKFLEIRWRKWLTRYYIDNWLKYKAYYKSRFLDIVMDNPDQRISEDINSFIVLFLSLTLGFINSIVTLASFLMVLWNLSGIIKFSLFGDQWIIHGYMVWVALIYSVIGTYIMFKIGKPLINLDFQQQAFEANFRYGLMRIREHAEPIAFYDGEIKECEGLILRFHNVVNNFVAIIYRQLKMGIFATGYGQVAIIFPFVAVAGRYFSKAIKLGDMIQISSAFGQVQGSLSYFISAYTSLAGARAVMNRLYGFQMAVDKANQLTGLAKVVSENYLTIKNLTISLPNSQVLAKDISFSLNQGERLLIQGRSGSGKTTLLRTIAGLWHYATGYIAVKPELVSLFIPQKPYLPIGTLKATLCYPKKENLPNNDELITFLKLCELEYLAGKLNEIADWSNSLSLGEQQKIAFCRILVINPGIIYLDEATSALDEETEAVLYGMLTSKLAKSVIVSVGHRSTIKKWHNQELRLNNKNFEYKLKTSDING